MINLLPPIEKEKFLMEKIKKVVIILWFLAFFLACCFILVLIALRIYANSQLEIQGIYFLETKNETKLAKVAEFRERIELINSDMAKLDSFYSNKVYFSDLIEKISEKLPSEVYLDNLSLVYVPGKETTEKVEIDGQIITKKRRGPDTIEVSLAGFSPNRDILVELKNNLESEESFENVFFPASNWVERYNIDFSISFEIKWTQ